MKTLLAQLDETEIALVAGGETEGGCIDPQPEPTEDPDIVIKIFNIEIKIDLGL